MLSRILVAVGLAAAAVSGAAVAFLRTDFVANNLCAYAVATIEEATAAQVQVARCSVEPEQGKVTIEGLHVGAPGGRLDLKVARVFAQVTVRPLLQKVRLSRLEIDHPELHLSLDQEARGSPARGGQCLPDMLDRFEFGRVQVRKASVEVTSSGMRLSVPRLGLVLKGRDGPLSIAVATRGGSLELPGRTVGFISTRTSAEVDLRGEGSVELRRGDVIGTEASAFLKGKLQNLCEPRIELSTNLRVDDLETAFARLLPGALRGVKGSLSTDAAFTLAKGGPRVKGELRLRSLALEGYSPGDARLRFDVTPARARIDRLELPVGRGQVSGSAEISLAEAGLPVTADLSLRDLELQELLRKLGLAHAWVVMRASGRVQAKGTLRPLQIAAEPALELADFAVLDRGYDARPSKAGGRAQRMFEFASGKLGGAVSIDADKVVLHNGKIDAGASQLEVESTFFTDLRKGMQIDARSPGVALADFRGHIGALPASGSAALVARVAGPYQALTIASSVSAHGFHLLDLSLGDVSTQLTFQAASMRLTLEQIRARKERSTYQGRLALDFSDPAVNVDARIELPDARVHDLIDLAMGLVPALSPLSDAGDLDGQVSGVLEVKGPLAGPEGTAALQFGETRLWGESFSGGSARVSLHGAEPRLQIEEVSLRRGDAALRAKGRFGPDWQLDIDATTENFTLADLDMARAAKLQGPMRAVVHVGGVAARPVVRATLGFEEGTAGEAELGEGNLALDIDGTQMKWKGTIGTHTLEGEARLADDFPYSCTASLRIPDLAQVLDLLAPEADIQSGSLLAGVELRGSLLRWRESAGNMTLSQLKVVRGDMAFENDGNAKLSFGPEGVRVERLALRAPYTSAQLSGSRGSDGKLDLRLTASIDGRVLQTLVPDVEHAAGTYLVQAAVGGTTREPTVLGNAHVEGGAVTLRGLPVAARGMNGSISFSQDALVIDSMTGKLNNGEARVSGGMELSRLVPKKIDLSAHVSDVNLKLDTVGATVDGDVTLYGPPDEPVLGGALILSQMKYTEDLDLERSLLDFSRRPPTPRVLSKSAMLLHFDLDVHLSRGVRLENNLARTDLKGDLKVTGTSRAVGLLGSVNTVHGTASFRGNEFQIEQGVLTFTDRQRIRPSFDFQASTQVKTAAVEYKVHLHAFGTPGEPHVSLNCEPALSEADLGFLLTFGFVSSALQQSNFSAADSGLAIGIEALNKATGFSDEVRRFIPKNAILRDPSIDFASDFSAATNRLEPMARFQSHLVSDRLDLKVLEGLTTRRYRGVVSYQLSDSFSSRLQLDNEHVTSGVGTDFGIDLHLRWEGE
ncbi:MAG TPA: translocation/assembly module TamB [Myxococcales bacterium]|nr:translocation/assembly module TamB [Myxococcales bacterium]